jgi:hypothetical protein
VIEDDPALLERLSDPNYDSRPERVFVFHVEAWDSNCPQHIRPRFTKQEIAPLIEKLGRRITELEGEIAALVAMERRNAADDEQTHYGEY